jgi:hypothetical protein
VDVRQVEALAAFVRARIDEQVERCTRALRDSALPMDVHMAMSVALAGAENERLLVSRWRAAELSAPADPAAHRAAAPLELAVTMIARLYRHHADYDPRWAG